MTTVNKIMLIVFALICMTVLQLLRVSTYIFRRTSDVTKMEGHNRFYNAKSVNDVNDYNNDFVYNLTKTNVFINPNVFEYTIANKDLCSLRKPDIVIGVQVGPKDRTQRDIIRNTWASDRMKTQHKALVVFFLGLSLNQTLMSEIVRENELYGDLVLDGYIDAFLNLSLKAVSMLKWVTLYCHGVSHFVHADGDSFVNIERIKLWNTNMRGAFKKRTASCRVFSNSAVIRKPDSKYSMPMEQFVYNVYPPYCSGCGYILNINAVIALYKASIGSGYVWLSDIFVTGLLAQKIGLHILKIPLPFYWALEGKPKTIVERSLFICHRNTAQMLELWNRVKNIALKL